jgi:hypothetical protein
MSSAPRQDKRSQVTALLTDVGNRKNETLDLLPVVYSELHTVAASYLRRESDARTVQPTAMINEAYMRLMAQRVADFQNRSHLFVVASHVMDEILMDHGRTHNAVFTALPYQHELIALFEYRGIAEEDYSIVQPGRAVRHTV